VEAHALNIQLQILSVSTTLLELMHAVLKEPIRVLLQETAHVDPLVSVPLTLETRNASAINPLFGLDLIAELLNAPLQLARMVDSVLLPTLATALELDTTELIALIPSATMDVEMVIALHTTTATVMRDGVKIRTESALLPSVFQMDVTMDLEENAFLPEFVTALVPSPKDTMDLDAINPSAPTHAKTEECALERTLATVQELDTLEQCAKPTSMSAPVIHEPSHAGETPHWDSTQHAPTPLETGLALQWRVQLDTLELFSSSGSM